MFYDLIVGLSEGYGGGVVSAVAEDGHLDRLSRLAFLQQGVVFFVARDLRAVEFGYYVAALDACRCRGTRGLLNDDTRWVAHLIEYVAGVGRADSKSRVGHLASLDRKSVV